MALPAICMSLLSLVPATVAAYVALERTALPELAPSRTRGLLQGGLDCDFTSYNAFLSPRSTETWSISNAGAPVFKSCFDISFDQLQLTDVYVNTATGAEQRASYLFSGIISFGSTEETCSVQSDGMAALAAWAGFLPSSNLTQYFAAGLPSRPDPPFNLSSICYDLSTDCVKQDSATVCSSNAASCPVTCGGACPSGTQWKLARTELGTAATANITTCCDTTAACTAYTSEVQSVNATVNAPAAATPPPTVGPPLTCEVTSYGAFLVPRSTETTIVDFTEPNVAFQSCLGLDFKLELVDVYVNSNTSEQTTASYWYTGTLTTGSITDTCANQLQALDLLQDYMSLLTGQVGLDAMLATHLLSNRPSLPYPPDTICADTELACRNATQEEVCAAGSDLAAACPVVCGTCSDTAVWQLSNTLLGAVQLANVTTCCDTTDACTRFSSEVEWSTSSDAPPLPYSPESQPLPISPGPEVALPPDSPTLPGGGGSSPPIASPAPGSSPVASPIGNGSSPAAGGGPVASSPAPGSTPSAVSPAPAAASSPSPGSASIVTASPIAPPSGLPSAVTGAGAAIVPGAKTALILSSVATLVPLCFSMLI